MSDNYGNNDKIADVQLEIDKAKENVHQSINTAIDRGDKLEELDGKADNLANEANMFNKQAKKTRRQLSNDSINIYAKISKHAKSGRV